MPSKSKAQQRFFAAIYTAQKTGDYSKLSGQAKKIAKTMSKKDVADFALTKTSKLPDKVKEELEIMEMIDELLNNSNTINESESIMDSQNNFYRTTKQLLDNFIKEIQISPNYKKDKIVYDEMILKIHRLFTAFDSKLREIIKPVINTRLNAIGGKDEESDVEASPEKGPNI